MRKKKIVLVILFVLVFLQVFPLISVSADSVLAQEGHSVTSVEEAPSKAVFAAPKLKPGDYPQLGWVKSREAVWVAAQVHLFFGAFVLAVPIFVLVIEGLGIFTKDERYDHIAHEIMKVSMTAFSLTALTGGLFTFALLTLYPDFLKYLMRIFQPTVIFYILAFIGEAIVCYTYYYSWDGLRYGTRKWIHLTLGLLLNTFGMTILFIADAWTGFMMTPVGVDAAGSPITDNIWVFIRNPFCDHLNRNTL